MGRRKLKGLPIHHAAGCPTATDLYSVEVVTGFVREKTLPGHSEAACSFLTGLREICHGAENRHKEMGLVEVIRPSYLLERQHDDAERAQNDSILTSSEVSRVAWGKFSPV